MDDGEAMTLIPNRHAVDEMLEVIGLDSIEDLFGDIPSSVRRELDLHPQLTEWEVEERIIRLHDSNVLRSVPTFRGGGVYAHHVPAAVLEIMGRNEFYTSYTPYQPELSQGMLQTIFEYQSLMSRLLNMDVVNASMYDGATALGEAARMALRISKKRNTILVPENIAPGKASVLENYLKGTGAELVKVPFDGRTGMLDTEALTKVVTEDTAALYVESPNRFGVLEGSLPELRSMLDKALLIVGVDPFSLGLLAPPGDFEADMVIGEGQPLGLPMNFGGPLLGIFAARKKYARQMPGRLVGMTEDRAGKRAFCMTLMTREQHIRRHRATSNICSNEGLCSVAAAVYMSLIGPRLRDLALQSYDNAHYLASQLAGIDGIGSPAYSGSFFNEFTVSCGTDPEAVVKRMKDRGIDPGIPITTPDQGDLMLVAATELHTREHLDHYIEAFREVVS